MKTTIDLPDELMVEVKKAAAERRTTIRALVEKGLRRELERPTAPPARKIRWVTVEGGLPADFDVANRSELVEKMLERRNLVNEGKR